MSAVRLAAKRRRVTLDDIRGEATIRVWPTLADLLGVSKDSAYAAVHSGEIPSLRLGRQYLVPVPALLRLLGDRDAEDVA